MNEEAIGWVEVTFSLEHAATVVECTGVQREENQALKQPELVDDKSLSDKRDRLGKVQRSTFNSHIGAGIHASLAELVSRSDDSW